jgi:hypothetical protein
MIDTSPMPGECEAISVVPLLLRPLMRPNDNRDKDPQVRGAAHGYEPTRDAAMAAFAKSWHRET